MLADKEPALPGRLTDGRYYLYIVCCVDNSLYTGITVDLSQRIAAHQHGRGARYTRARLPVQLCYWELCASRSEALQREYAIKQWSRARKLALIAGFQNDVMLAKP